MGSSRLRFSTGSNFKNIAKVQTSLPQIEEIFPWFSEYDPLFRDVENIGVAGFVVRGLPSDVGERVKGRRGGGHRGLIGSMSWEESNWRQAVNSSRHPPSQLSSSHAPNWVNERWALEEEGNGVRLLENIFASYSELVPAPRGR